MIKENKNSYYQKNRERIKKYNKDRRHNNPEVVQAEQRRYKQTRDLQILRSKIRSRKGILSYSLLSHEQRKEVNKILKKEFLLSSEGRGVNDCWQRVIDSCQSSGFLLFTDVANYSPSSSINNISKDIENNITKTLPNIETKIRSQQCDLHDEIEKMRANIDQQISNIEFAIKKINNDMEYKNER